MKKITSKEIDYFSRNMMGGYYEQALKKLTYWIENNYDLNIQYKKNNTLFFHIMQFNSFNYSHHKDDDFQKILDLIYDKVDINVKNVNYSYYNKTPKTAFEASLCWNENFMVLFKWLSTHPNFQYNLDSNDIFHIFKKMNEEGYRHYYNDVVDFLLPFMKHEDINHAITALIQSQENYNVYPVDLENQKNIFNEFKEKIDKLTHSPHFQMDAKSLENHSLSIEIFFNGYRSTDEMKEEGDKMIKYLEVLNLSSSIKKEENEIPEMKSKKFKL